MEDILLDDEGNFVAAADGDAATVSGARCIVQDVRHLLATHPGGLWAHPEYGVGLQRFLHAEDSELNRLELRQLIRLRLAEDERVKPGSVDVRVESWERDRIRISVRFEVAPGALAPSEERASEAQIVLTVSQEGTSFERV
jgi:phage baseplate assembly protein W